MRFELEGAFVFSGDLAPASTDIEAMLRGAEETYLMKGVPEGEEGPKVASHELAGSELRMVLVSGRYVRAHEALLRLRKELGSKLGKTHRVGVRGTRIDRYTIEFQVSEEPRAAVRVPFASSLEFEGETARMTLVDVSEDFLSRNYVDRLIALVREKVDAQAYAGKEEFRELIWSSPPRDATYTDDPTEDMARRTRRSLIPRPAICLSTIAARRPPATSASTLPPVSSQISGPVVISWMCGLAGFLN